MSSLRKILLFLFLTIGFTFVCAENSTSFRGACPVVDGKCSFTDFFVSLFSRMFKYCQESETCLSKESCCVDSCGFRYCQLVSEEVRECPDMSGAIGLCWEGCTDDSSCSNGQKCCFNGCGHDCLDTVVPGKPGKCPAPGIGTCIEDCQTDSSCPGSQKCCSNGCGHVCQDPV